MIPVRVKLEKPPPNAAKIMKQINFGVATGLTKTAKEGQKASHGALRGTFTLRGNWYAQSNKFGIKVKPAKRDDLSAEVRTQADWLELHEKGGTKTARGGTLAIPQTAIRPRGSTKKIVTRLKPRNLKRTFVIKTKSGPVLFQRVNTYIRHQGPTLKGGPTRRRKRTGSDIQAVYSFEPRARIRKQSTFFKPIDTVVRRRLRTNIDAAVNKAFATMR